MASYPGLGQPLRYFPQSDYGLYPMGAHGNCYGGNSDVLPVREVSMMIIMDRLMDKENWEKKVFDDEIIAKWRTEALEYPDSSLWKQATGNKVMNDWTGQDNDSPDVVWATHIDPLQGIMSNEAFDYCVQELRNKARYYEKSGLIPTIDACASVVKSDKFVSSKLLTELRNAFDKLKADQRDSPDWHPKSDKMVQDLIHPSMYPLVYGRSRVFNEEVVGVSDAIDKWAGKGEVIAKDDYKPAANDHFRCGIGGSTVPPSFWSDTYQWLPSNVAFQDGGHVRFTSYVNNLHPNKYPDIYGTIERLIERALPAWDQCLGLSVGYNEKMGAGRVESRFSKPEDPDDENPQNWDPSDPEVVANVEIDSEDDEEYDEGYDPEDDNAAERKSQMPRKPVQPQPDAFTDGEDYYAPKVGNRLSEKFKDSGLQIIVKMASIELTPEKPEFPVGGWHVEGQMNERICATALYYLDSENITPSNLSFRMQTSVYINDEYDIGQGAYHWMEHVYGTALGTSNAPCLQNYGSVETCEGRLLAFPNVFQHRVSPFRLADPTKPGHRRFIALWLVDPHTRIISTANVPPQQQDWWVESIFSKSDKTNNAAMSKLPVELAHLLQEKGVNIGSSQKDNGKLPPELREMVRENFGDAYPMSKEEAEKNREKLMEVRGTFHNEADDQWHSHSYNFCEH
ncbi:hypothetical protein BJ875DRAFT_458275 [Amylocarpus encephaloides]|uniref:Uncharacterized protein n=1 Tax=Amylocarpus encephaloides TaxID=45428 RepID=A0A9P7YL90_9HELO|nr:hypothetical protein BJ875DRAFT_458275 [Amylocarpus encephaloides]